MSEITIQEIDSILGECLALKRKHDEIKKHASEIWSAYEEKTNKFIGILQDLEKTEYRNQNGSFSFKEEYNYSLGKDEDSRKKFFDYLKEKGLHDSMITVHHASVNAYAKQEEKLAEEQGNFDFNIPGLVRSSVYLKPTLKELKK